MCCHGPNCFPLVSDPQESHPVVHPSPKVTGEYKSKLNELKQKGSIRDFSFRDDTERDTSGRPGFKSTLTVKFVHGGSYSFTSQFYYSSKQASQELAAERAIDAFNKQLTNHSLEKVHKRDLNNLMVGKYRGELPTYDTVKVGEQFKCTVSHPEIRRANCGVSHITCVGSSVKEAENIAAWRVLNLLGQK